MAKMTSTTSIRSRHASFAVIANDTAPYLLTCDDLLHLLHVMPHVGVTGSGPCPTVLHSAHRQTRVNIDRGRSRSPNGVASALVVASLGSATGDEGDPKPISRWSWSEKPTWRRT
jgi:hypothetical protein